MDLLNDLENDTIVDISKNISETMTILMLLGEEEKYALPSELMIEDIIVRSDCEVKDELLNRHYDTVFITDEYISIHGVDLAKNIVKLFTTLTSSRIHYLKSIGAEDYDEITVFLNGMGIGNVTKIDISKMTINDLRNLARENNAPSGIIKNQDEIRKDKLIILQTELRNLPDNMVQDYVKKNRGSLIGIINSYINTMQEIEELKRENNNLKKSNLHLEGSIRDIRRQLVTAEERRTVLREDLTALRKSILSQKDKIDDYNDRLLDNELVDSPKIVFDEMSPMIIYFKEIEDIGFFNFYESILYTLSKVYKYYVKSLVLETSNRQYFDPYTKLDYVTIPKDAPLEDVIGNDKLLRYGNPTNLLKAVANPEFKTEIIMIYDRTQTDDIVIDSPYLLPMYIGHSQDRVRTLEIDPMGWISPNEGNWKNIKPLLNYSNPNEEERLVFNSHVSKHPLTKYIRDIVNI